METVLQVSNMILETDTIIGKFTEWKYCKLML